MSEGKTDSPPVKTEADPVGSAAGLGSTATGKPKWPRKKNKNKKKTKQGTGGNSIPKWSFKGRTPGLEEFPFVTGPWASAQFAKSKEEYLHVVGEKNIDAMNSIINKRRHVYTPVDMPQVDNPSYDPTDAKSTEPPKIDKPKADFNYMEELDLKASMTELRTYNKALTDDLKWADQVLKGQCDEDLMTRMNTFDEYEALNLAADPIRRLALIQKVCFNYQNNEMPVVSIFDSLQKLYNLKQRNGESMTDFYARFRDQRDVVDACNGSIVNDGIRDYVSMQKENKTHDKLTSVEKTKYKPIIQNLAEATLFLMLASGNAVHVRTELNNDYVRGNDNYPTDVTEARAYIVNYKGAKAPTEHQDDSLPEVDDGLTLAQGAGKTPAPTGKAGVDMSTIVCRHPNCGQTGHFQNSTQCPERQKEMTKAAEYDKMKAKVDELQKKKTGGSSSADTGTNLHISGSTGHEPDKVTAGDALSILMGSMNCQTAEYSANVLGQQAKGHINPNYWLIDNQSTVDIFCNPAFLTDIRDSPGQHMHLRCNAGTLIVTQVGDLEGYGPVWYHPQAIANILSLSRVADKHLITYNSRDERGFVVHDENDQPQYQYKRSAQGLYFNDMSVHHGNTLAGIPTIAKNEEKYSARDVVRAKEARKFQASMGLSLQGLLNEIDNGTIRNNPITRRAARIAESIYGPCVDNLMGKTTYRKGAPALTEIEDVPTSIIERYRDVILEMDVFYVNGLRFLHTISTDIKYRTSQYLTNAKGDTLLESLVAVCSAYRNRGFKIRQVNADGQFKPVRASALDVGVPLNTTAEDEHAKVVERSIRTIKERTRARVNSLPFKRIPARILIGLVLGVTACLNIVVAMNGVSIRHSPRYILTGKHAYFDKHCKVQPGEYAHVHESHDNSMAPRTIGAIAIGSTFNDEGGVAYFSLMTGRQIERARATPLPMPADVIARVELMARRMPIDLTFGDRNNSAVHYASDEDDDDSDYDPQDHGSESDVDSDADTTADDYDAATVDDDVPPDDPPDDPPDANSVGAADGEEENNNENENDTDVDDDEDEETIGAPGAPPDDNAGAASAETVGAPRRAGLRTRAKINYHDLSNTASHLKTIGYHNLLSGLSWPAANKKLKGYVHAMHMIDNYNSIGSGPTIDHETVLSQQYTLKKGLQIFGEAGAAAVTTELQQLHDRGVLAPKLFSELTREQRARALAYLMFLKRKRDDSIKGRGCADGRPQSEWMSKEDTASPTVATLAMILSCMIDAKEGRDVATADIPGAFLQTDYDKGDTHLRIEGPMLELLTKLEPEHYRKYIHTYPDGKKVLFAEIKKAVYGTKNASLLFWLKLSATLRDDMGFEVNPYDWCCMNKTINGKQCTILWHVDDLKISHMERDVVTSILNEINDWYGEISPLTITRGKVHDYLGMTIDFTTPGQVKFTMIDYIDDFLSELPDDMRGTAVTPAAAHIFETNTEDPVLLNLIDRELFHHRVAKLLYLSKRARPDIQLPVAYLCTRVKEANTDDHAKLSRVTRYLDGTIGIPLILSMDESGKMRWYVDAAFAVHNDMKSHTGATMTMGQGAAYSQSSKQKLNTKSSTESEVVGVDDVLPQMIWCRYYLEGQGEEVVDNICYQDNESSMKLEKNGKRSSSKRTRHIAIRYYFITDRVSRGEISIEYCPTEDMVGDYHTKSLQGSPFRRFRNTIMGIKEEDIAQYNTDARQMLKEMKEKLLPAK